MQFLCYVTFSNADSRISIFFETSNGRLPLEDGSDRRETLPKRVSDDSRHLIFRRRKNFDEIFGAKSQHDIKNRSFWRSYEFLSVTSRFATKNHPRCPEFQVSTFLGEGVQRRISFFSLSFGPKPTFIFSSRTTIWWCDEIIWWYDDMIIWWYGMTTAGNLLFGAQEMLCVEHRTCFAWNTGSVLFGTQEMLSLEYTNVFRATKEISCLQ